MKTSISTEPIQDIKGEWLAIGFHDEESVPPCFVSTASTAIFSKLLSSKNLGTSVGETTPVLGSTGLEVDAVLAYGLGKREKFDAGASFSAGVAVAKKLAAKPREKVAVVLPPTESEPLIEAFLQGLIVGTQGPDLRKSERARHPFGELAIVAPPEAEEALSSLLRRAEVVGSAVNFARELANTPPAEKAPTAIAARIRDQLALAGVPVEVWDRSAIEAAGFGGLLGVSAGSDEPPAFVRISYKQGGAKPTLALVGKGVTFDSGGLSLKPSASMEDMKSDMTGAAVVASTIWAVAQLGLPVNVEGYLAFTENMTGGKAMKLGDVLKMRNGKTVEVMNTDAEGRLILADALSFAVESKPAKLIDLATLTGACLVALGSKVAGLFSNDDALTGQLKAAATATGERVWRLPLDDDYFEAMKSPVADFKNVGGKWGGAVTAAKFLQQFIGETPWIHLDIAGPSWSESENSTRDAGGTGCFVRTLVRFIESESNGINPSL